MSFAEFKPSDIGKTGQAVLKVLGMLRLITMETVNQGEKKGYIRVNNLTLINFVIKLIGPVHEATLTTIMLGIQVGRHRETCCM